MHLLQSTISETDASLKCQLPNMRMQVLSQFAPTLMATGDSAGASKMLTSGLTLAKSMHDLPTQVSSNRTHAPVNA